MATAMKKRQEEPAVPPLDLVENLKKAVALHKENNLKEAEKIYKQALIDSKHQDDIVILVALFYQQIGRHKYVITLLKKLISKTSDHFKAHHLIGKSYLATEQYETALDHLSQAHILDHTHAEVAYKKGVCHHTMCQLEQALSHYKKALNNKDTLAQADQIDLYNAIADIHLNAFNKTAATDCLQEAIDLNLADYNTLVRFCIAKGESNTQSLKCAIDAITQDPTKDEAKALFARSCELGRLPSLANEQMKQVISACLDSKNVNLQSIAIPWILNFFLLADKEKASELLKTENYADFKTQLEDETTKNLFHDPYFYSGLKNIRANRINLERIYTFFRRFYLQKMSAQSPLSEEDHALLGAIAQQCFLNEYVFYNEEEETNYIEQLKEELEALPSFAPEHHNKILLYACYRPLLSLKNQTELEKQTGQTTDFEEVITVQIKEPLEEQNLQKSIKTLGTINAERGNQVTQSVRQQYEENPYPRWKTESVFEPLQSKAIAKKYQKKSNVLIAGCGTGKQIVCAYNFYPNASFVGIDISRASLAYAKRKLIDYNFEKNVQLYQCDILDSHLLNQEFDFIECCGVLHHMQNPEDGLNELLKLLKPGGRITLALYSKRARQEIVKARAYIKQKGFEPTTEDIRSCRKMMMDDNFVNNDSFPLYQWRDFNTLSECRDLLFHVQEICYDPLMLKQMLEKAGLTFEGFRIDQTVLAAFHEMFPENDRSKDLTAWEQYEQSHPTTFAGMYQFMATKPLHG